MPSVSEYLQKAELADQSAARTADPHFRELLRAMAREWRTLAEHARAFDAALENAPAAPPSDLDSMET